MLGEVIMLNVFRRIKVKTIYIGSQCCGSGSASRPVDPDPNPFQLNVKLNFTKVSPIRYHEGFFVCNLPYPQIFPPLEIVKSHVNSPPLAYF
jgi:hypothetical protein